MDVAEMVPGHRPDKDFVASSDAGTCAQHRTLIWPRTAVVTQYLLMSSQIQACFTRLVSKGRDEMRRVSAGFVRAWREREMSLALSTSFARVEFQPWYVHPAQDGGEERDRERREGEREKD